MSEPTTLVRLTKAQYDAIATTAAVFAHPDSILGQMAQAEFADPFTPMHPPLFDPVKVRFPDGSVRSIVPIAYERPVFGRSYDRDAMKPVFDVPGYVFDEVIAVDVRWHAVEGEEI